MVTKCKLGSTYLQTSIISSTHLECLAIDDKVRNTSEPQNLALVTSYSIPTSMTASQTMLVDSPNKQTFQFVSSSDIIDGGFNVTSFTPVVGSAIGGTELTITGTYFHELAAKYKEIICKIGNMTMGARWVDKNTVQCTTPPVKSMLDARNDYSNKVLPIGVSQDNGDTFQFAPQPFKVREECYFTIEKVINSSLHLFSNVLHLYFRITYYTYIYIYILCITLLYLLILLGNKREFVVATVFVSTSVTVSLTIP